MPQTVSRRSFLQLPIGLAPVLLASDSAAAARTENADWPGWAPSRATLYARLESAAKGGRDIRTFGAVLDGRADDTAALERAVAVGTAVLLIPAIAGAAIRITRQIRLSHPITIIGIGGRPTIRVETPENDLFVANVESADPTSFLQQVRIDNIRFVRPAPLRAHGMVVRAWNLRQVSITRCTAERMGLLGLKHTRQRLGQYRRASGSILQDPAVLAGFSATATDDLSEDILLFDNHVDAQTHMSQLARFEFCKRVAIAGNVGLFANVSWWGGGAKRKEGGDLRHLRRVRDVYIADNEFSGANGVYGNNGDGIVIARNKISMMTDVGVDFEGCFNAQAYDNVVRNIGNFCFATFYAAKNIVFRNNIGVQDGSATDIHLRFGRRVGRQAGHTLFAQRSGGFGTSPGAISVALIDNDFAWKGSSGLGSCLPSFFTSLELRRNRFTDVTCDMGYPRTGAFILVGNQFDIGRPAPRPIRLCASSAASITMTGNVIRSVPQPAGTIAILAQLHERTRSVKIADNRVISGTFMVPIVLRGSQPLRSSASVTGNQAAAIMIEPGFTVDCTGNRNAVGAPVSRQALSPLYATPVKPGTAPVDADGGDAADDNGDVTVDQD